MRATRRLPSLIAAVMSVATLTLSTVAVLAQSPLLEPHADADVVPDDMLTLVVGTRFVAASEDGTSARAQFTSARIPLSAFNDTDRCVDQQALEAAKEYFTTLGRMLGKAGYYYFVPDDAVRKIASMCEKLYHRPPRAWVDKRTKVIAFGRVVPTVDAPNLEKSIR